MNTTGRPTALKVTVDSAAAASAFSWRGRQEVRVLRTEKQKDNLAKFFWDISKLELTLFVIGPLAKPKSISPSGVVAGLAIGLALSVTGYIIDGREWRR